MKGKYFMEQVSNESSGVSNERRLVYNTSTLMNGAADQFGQYKMFFHGQSKWLRPLVANNDDGPDSDDTRTLGHSSYRFKAMYAVDFYGQVRYS